MLLLKLVNMVLNVHRNHKAYWGGYVVVDRFYVHVTQGMLVILSHFLCFILFVSLLSFSPFLFSSSSFVSLLVFSSLNFCFVFVLFFSSLNFCFVFGCNAFATPPPPLKKIKS